LENKEHLKLEKRCTIYANNGNKVHLLEGWGVRIKKLCNMLKSQSANRHIWFLPTHKPKRKKPKEPIFLPTLERNSNETNEMYIEK